MLDDRIVNFSNRSIESEKGNMSFIYTFIIFFIVSIAITRLSWPSLKSFRYHGFYRFFAFEAILILVLLNINYWFDNPFNIFQILSWILLLISAFMAVYGFISLRKLGKPDRRRIDPSIIAVEKTTVLVIVGAYRYIRHPLYASLFYGVWGVFFKRPSGLGLALTLFTIIFVTLTAKIEEIENIGFFGEAYRNYMKQTKMFVPFLF